MFFLLAVIIGLIIGFARGGRLSNLRNVKLSFWIPGVLGALLLVVWHLHRYIPFLMNTPAAVPVIGFVGYVFLMVALIFNLDSVWAIFMMVGTVSNFVVTFINGGKMPVLESIVRMTGDQNVIDAVIGGTHASYGLLTVSNSTLWFLGVNVPIPVPIVGNITNLFGGMPGLSIGSMVLFVGVAGWISHQMVSHDFRKALMDDLSSDTDNDFVLEEDRRRSALSEDEKAILSEERAEQQETVSHSQNNEAENLVSEELFKRDTSPTSFSEKPDYFEQVHALRTGELLVTDIKSDDATDKNESGTVEMIDASAVALSEKSNSSSESETEVVPVIATVKDTIQNSATSDFTAQKSKPQTFNHSDTKVISSLRDLKNAEVYARNTKPFEREKPISPGGMDFDGSRQGQGQSVDFDSSAFWYDEHSEERNNEKKRWEIPDAGRNGFLSDQNDVSAVSDKKSDELEPSWVTHPTYQKEKSPKEKISYKKNPYRKGNIQKGNTMKKDDNKKSEQDMMNVWRQMSEDNQAIRHKRRRKTYDGDDEHPFAQPSKNPGAEQKSDKRADYSHYEQASASGRRKQAEQVKQAEVQRDVNERPKRRRSTDEERRRAGFEKVEVNVDGRIVTFWRKRKNK